MLEHKTVSSLMNCSQVGAKFERLECAAYCARRHRRRCARACETIRACVCYRACIGLGTLEALGTVVRQLEVFNHARALWNDRVGVELSVRGEVVLLDVRHVNARRNLTTRSKQQWRVGEPSRAQGYLQSVHVLGSFIHPGDRPGSTEHYSSVSQHFWATALSSFLLPIALKRKPHLSPGHATRSPPPPPKLWGPARSRGRGQAQKVRLCGRGCARLVSPRVSGRARG
eukprot:6185338-Pleurochrysis_carterae.AAC.1